MSRIGKQPIPVPAGVDVTIDGASVTVKGPKGTLSQSFDPDMQITLEDGVVLVRRPSDERRHRSLHGLTRTLVANMVTGVSEGFRKDLEIVGVGYRAELSGDALIFQLGYSHRINFPLPKGISAEVPKPTQIVLKGIDKALLGYRLAVDPFNLTLRHLHPEIMLPGLKFLIRSLNGFGD